MDEIVGHEKDDNAVLSAYVTKETRHTTKGWRLLVSWKDGTSSYVPLREMKNSYPIETSDYTIANGLALEPAFAWSLMTNAKDRPLYVNLIKIRPNIGQEHINMASSYPRQWNKPWKSTAALVLLIGETQLTRKCIT